MNRLQQLVNRNRGETRSGDLSLSDYFNMIYTVNGNSYLAPMTTYGGPVERPVPTVAEVFVRNDSALFSVLQTRASIFSEARFQFRRFANGRPGDLFGLPALQILEQPWPNGTTGELLTRMEQDSSIWGNFFATVGPDGYIKRLNPNWTNIIRAHNGAPANEISYQLIGYTYAPGGDQDDLIMLSPDQVCHYSPIPDPLASYRGMSWMTPLIRELESDIAQSEHKLKFFEHAATPNMTFKFDPQVSPETVAKFADMIERDHSGVGNAYKNLYLGGGADTTVVGSNFQQMDFHAVQSAGEIRIAAAAGVPPVIAGLGEPPTYNNYAEERRRFSDMTLRPLWRSAAAALSSLVVVPTGAELWYDDRDVKFLQEDQQDGANIRSTHAQSIQVLIMAGFEADAVVEAVNTGDYNLLIGQHTGMMSVQMQPPVSDKPPTGNPPQDLPPVSNGNEPALTH